MAQQRHRVGAPPSGVGVREVLADVAQSRRTQEGIGDGMGYHVGIGVPGEAAPVEPDAAKDQRSARASSLKRCTSKPCPTRMVIGTPAARRPRPGHEGG